MKRRFILYKVVSFTIFHLTLTTNMQNHYYYQAHFTDKDH